MRKDLINVLVNVLPIEDYDELTSYIARLEKENKVLRENAENNDKVVDKVHWENQLLKNRIDKTTNYYYKKLAECLKENKQMPDESVMMFNLLEGNR